MEGLEQTLNQENGEHPPEWLSSDGYRMHGQYQSLQPDGNMQRIELLLCQMGHQGQQERLEIRQDLIFICQFLKSLAERQDQQWQQIHYHHEQIISETRHNFQALSSLFINSANSQTYTTPVFPLQENQINLELTVPSIQNRNVLMPNQQVGSIIHQNNVDEQRAFSFGTQDMTSSNDITLNLNASPRESLREERNQVMPESKGYEQDMQSCQNQNLAGHYPDHQTFEQKSWQQNGQSEALGISNLPQAVSELDVRLLNIINQGEEHHIKPNYILSETNERISGQSFTKTDLDILTSQQRVKMQLVDEQKVPARHVDEQKVPARHVDEQKVPARHVDEQKLHPRYDNEQKIPVSHIHEQKVQTRLVNEQKVQARHVNEQKVHSRYDNEQKVHPRYDNEQKVQTRHDNEKKVQARHDNEQKVYPRYDNEQKVHSRYDNDKKVHPRYDNEQKVHSRYDNEQKVHPRYDNEKKVQARYDNEQKLHSSYDNEQKVHSRHDNEQKVHSRHDNEQKVHSRYDNEQKVHSRYDNEQKVHSRYDNEQNVHTGPIKEQNIKPQVENEQNCRSQLVGKPENVMGDTNGLKEQMNNVDQKLSTKKYADAVVAGHTPSPILKCNSSSGGNDMPMPFMDASNVPENQESFKASGFYVNAISKLYNDGAQSPVSSVKSMGSSNGQTYPKGPPKKYYKAGPSNSIVFTSSSKNTKENGKKKQSKFQ